MPSPRCCCTCLSLGIESLKMVYTLSSVSWIPIIPAPVATYELDLECSILTGFHLEGYKGVSLLERYAGSILYTRQLCLSSLLSHAKILSLNAK